MAAPDFTDEMLMAFADGELDEAAAEEVAAALAQDPVLARRVQAFTASGNLVRTALGPLDRASVPPTLRAAVEAAVAKPTGQVVTFPAKRMPSAAWLALPIAASLALVVGGVGGYVVGQRPAEGPGASFVLGSDLGRALDELASGATRPLDGAEIRMIATFEDGRGALCRELTHAAPSGTHTAVACHAARGWELRFAAATPNDGDGYAPASTLDALEAYLMAIEAGPALEEDAERAALSRLR